MRKGSSGFSGPTVAKIWRDYYNLLAKDKRICAEMNLESKFEENYDAALGKVVYSSSGLDIEATEDPNEIGATEEITTFTFAPTTQEPNTNPVDPNIPQETEQPAWEYRPTTEPVTEPPTDDGDDEEDNSNNNNNGNGNGNGNGFWNPGN